MIQYIRKAFAGLVLLVTAISPIFAMGPTHRISADLLGSTRHFPSDINIVYHSARGKIGSAGEGNVVLMTDTPNVGVSGGPFTADFAFFRDGGRGRPTTEQLYGVVSDGNGIAYSNGYQVNYFATVTITGGTGRFAGATGTINVMVYQYGLFDYGNIESFVSSEILLDGQYSPQ